MKRCTKCGVEKPRAEFESHGPNNDGVRGSCRSCRRERARASDRKYRAENRDKVRASSRESSRKYREANPDKDRESSRKYRAANLDKVRTSSRERGRKYRAENLDKARESSRKWRAANLGKHNAYESNRRARRLAAIPADITACERDEIARLYVMLPVVSALIGEPMNLDHEHPLSRGGAHSLANLRFLPARINIAKGAKLDSECTGEVGEFLNSPPTFHQVSYLVRRSDPRKETPNE